MMDQQCCAMLKVIRAILVLGGHSLIERKEYIPVLHLWQRVARLEAGQEIWH